YGGRAGGVAAIGDKRRWPDSCLDVGFRAPGPEDAVRNQIQQRGVNLANDRAANERERAAAASGNGGIGVAGRAGGVEDTAGAGDGNESFRSDGSSDGAREKDFELGRLGDQHGLI